MSQMKILLLVALLGSFSFTFLLLACALPQYGAWWPMFVLIFYVLTPIPLYAAQVQSEPNSVRDICSFIATVLVFSAYALPILFARVPSQGPLIEWGACALTLTANTCLFGVIFWVVYMAAKGSEFFE